MYDTFVMGRCQAMCDLDGVSQRFALRQQSSLGLLPDGLAFQQLRHHVGHSLVSAHLKHGEDIGVVQGRCCPRFLLESPQAVGVGRQERRQYLDRHIPA
jgi:hypothetical protein